MKFCKKTKPWVWSSLAEHFWYISYSRITGLSQTEPVYGQILEYSAYSSAHYGLEGIVMRKTFLIGLLNIFWAVNLICKLLQRYASFLFYLLFFPLFYNQLPFCQSPIHLFLLENSLKIKIVFHKNTFFRNEKPQFFLTSCSVTLLSRLY